MLTRQMTASHGLMKNITDFTEMSVKDDIVWRNVTESYDSIFLLEGTSLASAIVPGTNFRFLIEDIRTIHEDGSFFVVTPQKIVFHGLMMAHRMKDYTMSRVNIYTPDHQYCISFDIDGMITSWDDVNIYPLNREDVTKMIGVLENIIRIMDDPQDS